MGWQKTLHIYFLLFSELNSPQYFITQLMIMFSFRTRVYLCSVFMGKLSLIFARRCFFFLDLAFAWPKFGVTVVDRCVRRANARCSWFMVFESEKKCWISNRRVYVFGWNIVHKMTPAIPAGISSNYKCGRKF